MTFVPDIATICTCYRDATDEQRAAVNRNRAGPHGICGCERCHGTGFYIDREYLTRHIESLNDLLQSL